jgi:hypothetical protein
VLFGIHDVVLPDDYPDRDAARHWTEQYVLGAYLLGGASGAEVVFPSWYVSRHPALAPALDPLWARLPPVERHGGAFWMLSRER